METPETIETQQTISDWANETFGDTGSNLRVAQRANEEMKELLEHLENDDNHIKAAEECADIFIVLYRLGVRLGVDLHAEVQRKMSVNRNRTWLKDGTGCGHHI